MPLGIVSREARGGKGPRSRQSLKQISQTLTLKLHYSCTGISCEDFASSPRLSRYHVRSRTAASICIAAERPMGNHLQEPGALGFISETLLSVSIDTCCVRTGVALGEVVKHNKTFLQRAEISRVRFGRSSASDEVQIHPIVLLLVLIYPCHLHIPWGLQQRIFVWRLLFHETQW